MAKKGLNPQLEQIKELGKFPLAPVPAQNKQSKSATSGLPVMEKAQLS